MLGGRRRRCAGEAWCEERRVGGGGLAGRERAEGREGLVLAGREEI